MELFDRQRYGGARRRPTLDQLLSETKTLRDLEPKVADTSL